MQCIILWDLLGFLHLSVWRANITCGVPQGSRLGPLPFNLYVLSLIAITQYPPHNFRSTYVNIITLSNKIAALGFTINANSECHCRSSVWQSLDCRGWGTSNDDKQRDCNFHSSIPLHLSVLACNSTHGLKKRLTESFWLLVYSLATEIDGFYSNNEQ